MARWSVMRSLISISGADFLGFDMGIVSLGVVEEVKRFTEKVQRKGGEKSEKEGKDYRRGVEHAEEGGRDPSAGQRQGRRPQDDDARRIVRKAVAKVVAWQHNLLLLALLAGDSRESGVGRAAFVHERTYYSLNAAISCGEEAAPWCFAAFSFGGFL